MNGFWTVRRAAAAVGVKMPDDRPLSAVSTDTRTVQSGDLFVALRGEKFDAHDFLRDAVARGAAALMVEDGANAAGTGVPVITVPNTLTALGLLAKYYRIAWSGPVVAVGGSNGKTTTKEMVRAALSARFAVHATTGNLNNQIGVPMTLLGLRSQHEIAVVEVGTNMPGEIPLLREITRPDIAVITTVQEEHLEGFGDLAGVMAEEMSLCDDVALAVVPAAEPVVVAEATRRAKKVIAVSVPHGPVGPLPGAHNHSNASLAIAVAEACGLTHDEAAAGLGTATFPPMRSAVSKLGDAILVNDAYNANPASMRAALALLADVADGRPMVAVLGTMREMGASSDAVHDDIARAALASKASVIGAVGEFAAAFQRVGGTDPRVVGAADPDGIWPLLLPRLTPRSAILLKASRGVRLERVVPQLEAWAKAQPPT